MGSNWRACGPTAEKLSTDSETLWEIVESIAEGFAVFDADGRLLICNESYRSSFPEGSDYIVLGMRFEDIAREGLARGRFPDAIGREEEWLAERLEEHHNPMGASEHRLSDGRWIQVAKRRMANGWTASLRVDISALKAAQTQTARGQERLFDQERAAERRFRSAVEAAPNAMIMVDASGRIAMLNDQAERMFDYSRSELLGQPIEVLVPPRFRGAHPELRTAFFSEPGPRPMGAGRDLFGLRKDGSEFPVEIGLNPTDTDVGAMVIASVVDISARKKAELELRESEHRFRSLAAIVASSDDAIVGTALDGTITAWNRASERIFGYSADEAVGQSVLILAPPGGEEEMLAILDRIRAGGRVEHYETQRRRSDGAVLDISLTESPVYDADGRLVGMSKVARDITENRRAEAALRESEGRLQELHAELLHVSRLSAMGQMAAMLAHELNQPLTAISNYMEAVNALLDRGREVPADRLRGVVERAGEQAVRAGQIIQRLRELVSRGDTEKRIEALPPLLREARELALIGTKQRGLPIRVEEDIPEVTVIVDKIQIQQVLLNLLRNAAEAISGQENGGIVLGATEHADGTLEVSIADNGPGLPEEVRDKLFQPFVSTKKTGMGVGLSICHTIIAAHNGRLWAETNPGGGTVFRMTLPRASLEEA